MNDFATNQIIASDLLFFDHLHKKATIDPACRNKKHSYRQITYHNALKGVEVIGNGTVCFRFYAPEASKVEIAGIGGGMTNQKHLMKKGTNGYWTVTLHDIPPGFHYHDYFVDEQRCINPIAPLGYGCFHPINFFEMPGDDDSFYLLQDVPHGDIRMELYPSPITGRTKCCYVYTPPGYDDSQKQYPIVYLQHGVGENESGWIWQGKLNLIVDNLLAKQQCEEMIMVINCGYAFIDGEEPTFFPGDFDTELVKGCLPFIEEKYRVKQDKKYRAMAGLSLGSTQAFSIAMHHLDLFSWLGVFSGGFPIVRPEYNFEEFYADPTMIDTHFALAFFSAGEAEPFCQELGRQISEIQAKGSQAIQHYHCRGHHVWDVWRFSAHAFIQQLFRKKEDLA